MPGEERPSVAPYDDNAKTLVTKVEKVRKETGTRISGQNEGGLDTDNMLAVM